MKKILCLAILSIFLLSGCSQFSKVKETVPVQQNATEKVVMVDINKTAEFKVTRQFGVRFPPSINGTIKNEGLGRGSVKVIARIFYAGVIADEKMMDINDVKPDEEINFGLAMSEKAQWSSYTVILENK